MIASKDMLFAVFYSAGTSISKPFWRLLNIQEILTGDEVHDDRVWCRETFNEVQIELCAKLYND